MLSTLSALAVNGALVEVQFPADRQAILAQLRISGAPVEAMDTIEQLPNRRYATPAEVADHVTAR